MRGDLHVGGGCYVAFVSDEASGLKVTGSLDVIIEEARIERAAQLKHFDGLDAKAGLVLGFAGAIVALAPSRHLVVDLGRAAAVAAGLMALWTFLPRKYELTNVFALREKYLAAEPRFTKLALLDAQISMMSATKKLLELKAARLKLAMAMLALGITLLAVGIPIH
jgi:hypothetical protein